MAGLITVEDLREKFPFEIHTDIGDDRLALPLVSASRRLRGWIGTDTYDAVVAEDETEERHLVLQHAEGYLAMHYAILGLQTQVRNFGLVKREQVEGNTVNEYFGPNETANLASQYLETAREIADEYASFDGSPIAMAAVAIDTETSNSGNC